MDVRKNILILTFSFIFLSLFFWAKTGNMLIDFSREVYIPFQMLNGQKLTKDIFLIYGPFGYILNFILYSIKPNINFLLLEAHLISYGILIAFYFILNKFFVSKVSLVLSIIFLFVSIFSDSTFSFVLPYSFSTLWAIFGIYLSLFSLLYNKKNILFLSLGLVLVSKIELFVFAAIIVAIYYIYKKEKISKDILYILIFPAFCMLYYFVSGISIDNIIQNYSYLKKMISTPSLEYLYKGMGVFFNLKYFQYNLILLIKLIFIFGISYYFNYIKKSYFSYFILMVGLLFLNLNLSLNLIGFISVLITLFVIKNNKITAEEMLLFIFSLILCSKAFFAINSLSYSNFGYCLIIFYTYLQAQKFIDKKWLLNSLIIFFVLNFSLNLSYYFNNQKEKLKTKVGCVFVKNKEYELFASLNSYIEKNVKINEKFIVLPEGQIFNLIHKKNNYGFFNSTFTPLDFDTFGEAKLIDKLKYNKIDYIIFYPRNTKDYGAEIICFDYAVDFCTYIMDNYTQVAEIKKNDTVQVFKINNEK